MGLVGGVGLFAVKYHQRATNKFFSSLLTTSNSKLSRIKKFSYLLRGPMFVGNGEVPINSLDLRDSFKAVAVIGANRSGKTVFISNYILRDMFPWWYRFFFPPRGLFFDRKSETSHNRWVAQEPDFNNRERRPVVCHK